MRLCAFGSKIYAGRCCEDTLLTLKAGPGSNIPGDLHVVSQSVCHMLQNVLQYLGVEYGLLAGWENGMCLTVTSIGWRIGAEVERYVQCVPVLFSIRECCL